MLYIVGLGPGDPDLISRRGWELLTSCSLPVVLRTSQHPVAMALSAGGHAFETYDGLYESEPAFENIYAAIVKDLWQRAEAVDVVYAVPGNPMVAESTVQQLLTQDKSKIKIVAAPSSLEAVYVELGLDPARGLAIGDALDLSLKINPQLPWLITQVHSRLVAGDLKLRLLEIYPPDHTVSIVRRAGTGASSISQSPLFELDHREFSPADTLYLPACPEGRHVGVAMEELAGTMRLLRGIGGCPWDREQTHRSLRPYLIEEAYEVLSALESEKPGDLAEELGDLLLQIVFHAQIATEAGDFELYDCIQTIMAKLKRRHPHVFGDFQATTAQQVEENWRRIKQLEKASHSEGWLESVPMSLPALQLAYKLQVRAGQVGFDWPSIEGALDKVSEELVELQQALGKNKAELVEAEFGDLLFSIVNVSRFLKIEPEAALRGAARKFKQRFWLIEQFAVQRGLEMVDCSLAELDRLWEEAKKQEK